MATGVFEAVDEARWKQAAIAGLRGAGFDKLIVGTPEGIPLEPLYLERHAAAIADRGAPGSQPYVRGTWAPGEGRALIAQRLEPGAALADALSRGVDAPWLVVREPGQLTGLLQGVELDSLLLLDAGESAPESLAAARSLGAKRVSALFDPFATALAHGGLDTSLNDAFDRGCAMLDVTRSVGAGGVRSFAVSAACIHEAGGHAGQAIGFALASCLELVRALSRRGAAASDVLSQLAIIASPGTDALRGIALLRALRLAWSKLLAAIGVQPAPAPFVIATSAMRSASRLDVATNLVRESLQSFAALAGGADVVAPRAFDAVGEASPLGVRMVVNTALVLSRESLIGRVSDPAGGSHYVEALTQELARAGWDELRSIEREGGLVASLEAGRFQRRVREASAARRSEIATRRRVIVGASDFADPNERVLQASSSAVRPAPAGWAIAKLEPEREAEPFEALRVRAAALHPRALLLCLGSPADFRLRESFARRFLEAGGFEVCAAPSGGPGWVRRALQEYTPHVVVLCSSDDHYASSTAAVLRDARAAGAVALVLAGKPGALEPALREAGLTHAMHVGVDAVAVLSSLLDAAEGQ